MCRGLGSLKSFVAIVYVQVFVKDGSKTSLGGTYFRITFHALVCGGGIQHPVSPGKQKCSQFGLGAGLALEDPAKAARRTTMVVAIELGVNFMTCLAGI